MKVAALFVDTSKHGIYPQLLGHELCWGGDEVCLLGSGDPPYRSDDARTYAGPHPVVTHPPCNLWVNMAQHNYRRYKDRSPEHEERLRPGNDQGCFAAALKAVLLYGGVLEHPAGSLAWKKHNLPVPSGVGVWTWQFTTGVWTCEIWQSAYGHKARKRTWLAYYSPNRNAPPFNMRWARVEGTHQIGWFDRKKPTLGKREASATPIEFAKELIRLAEHAGKER